MPRQPFAPVRWLAKAACWVFYRVDTVGCPLDTGATLILPNHANALLDPAIVWATARRDVRFLAKSTLFAGPLRPVLTAARAIPVYRRLDQGADISRNLDTFAAVNAALAEGDAVCIFPEGISHSSGRLEPLRTGAARMAMSAERDGTAVSLVPVGLNFDRKTMFRSRVTVAYGPPFSCSDLLHDSSIKEAAAVRALTDRIASHMRQLLVEADPHDDAALIERVDRLYAAARGRPRDAAERLERRRVIAASMDRLRVADPRRYADILLRLRRYDQRLRRFGLRDRHLDWQLSAPDVMRFAVRESLFALLLIPLTVAGLLAFFVPYKLTATATRISTRDRDVIATAQVFSGLFIYGAWLALGVMFAWWKSGATAAIAVSIGVPLAAVGALFAIERESAVLDAVRAWLLLRRTRDQSRTRLRRYRSELADVLDEVHSWLSRASV